MYDDGKPEHTYESMAKNRQSIAPDSNAGNTTTFTNGAFEDPTYDKNEYDNRR